MRIYALLLCVGCAGHPHVTRTISPPRIEAHPLSLVTETFAGIVTITASQDRTCHYDIVEKQSTEGRGTGGGLLDPETPESRVADTVDVPCPIAAGNLPVTLTTPSGATFQATTEADGTLVFVLPPSEQTADRVTVTTPELPPTTPVATPTESDDTPGEASPPKPGLAVVRDAMIECGAQLQMHGLVKLVLRLGAGAEVLRVHSDRGSDFGSCVEGRVRGMHLDISRPAGDLPFPYALR